MITVSPVYSTKVLRGFCDEAIAIFREERLQEPLELYLEHFDVYLGVTEDLLEATVDLMELEARALEILTNKSLLEAFRYLAAPPISVDDLKTLSEVKSLAPGKLKVDSVGVRNIVRTVLVGLDRRRFPWVDRGDEPTETERSAAVLATAALLATQRVNTLRRNTSKTDQEQSVEDALIRAGFKKVKPRDVHNINQAPRADEFCRECEVVGRKADFVIGLFDGRILCLECKVSNSGLNSLKRVNNDAAVKATAWLEILGPAHVVPAAMLGGVYKLSHLESAQASGLTLFWAHRLDEFVAWVLSTREQQEPKRVAEPKRAR